ncbi:MAG TPA: hypothetical protein QF478_06215, partial [Verrucomicrobiota bacterium]|nr:hypothetical protein [Verrucomicrobiota bacterium]
DAVAAGALPISGDYLSPWVAGDAGDAPALSIVNNGDGNVTVTFEGKLQGAATVNGPWQDATALLPGWDGSSPVTIPASEAQFYGRAVNE